MSEVNGGAAFAASGHPGQQFVAQEGMTLRDYFAAKLVSSVIGSLNGPVTHEEHPGDFDYYANCAYKMADAMLRARGQ